MALKSLSLSGEVGLSAQDSWNGGGGLDVSFSHGARNLQ